MKRIHRIALISLIIALMASLVPVNANEISPQDIQSPAQEDELKTVRIGLVPVLIYSPLFIADAQGYFAEEGIQIETLNIAGGSEPLAPLARGELDVVFGGTGAGLFNYAARNIDTEGDPNFRIVSSAHTERPSLTSPLVVSKERFDSGEITSVADLAGGRVAINAAGAATEYWLAQALAQGDLTYDDVEILAVGFPDVPAALNSGAEDRIDAAILGEPIAAAAEAQGLVTRLSDDFISDFQATFVFMSNEFIEEDRETAVAFMRAILRAYRDLQDVETWSEPAIVEYLSEVTFGYSEELLDFYAFPFFDPNGAVSTDNINTLQDYFLEQGSLAYDEALDVNVFIDSSLVEEVLADLGEYEVDEMDMDEDEMDESEDMSDEEESEDEESDE